MDLPETVATEVTQETPTTQATEVSEPKTNAAADSKPWTDEEDALVLKLVATLGPSWTRIAAHFPERSDSSVRNRYSRLKAGPPTDAKPPRDRGAELPWSAEEEEKLHLGVAMYGARWSTITRTLFPGRTVNAVRNRFNRQLRKPGSSAGALASAVAGAPAGAQSGTSSGQAGPTENKLPVALALPMPGKNDSDQLPPAPYPPGYPPANGYPPPPAGWPGYPPPPPGYSGYPPWPNYPMPGYSGYPPPPGYPCYPGYPGYAGYPGYPGHPVGGGYPAVPMPDSVTNERADKADDGANPAPAPAVAIPVNLGGAMPTAQALPMATGSLPTSSIGASGSGPSDGAGDFDDMAMASFRLSSDLPTNFILGANPKPRSDAAGNSRSTSGGRPDLKEAPASEILSALDALGATDSKLNHSFDKLDISGGSIFKMSGSNSNSIPGAGLSDDSWGRVLAVDLLGSSSQDAQEEFSRTETDPQERSRSWLKEAMNLAPKDLARLH